VEKHQNVRTDPLLLSQAQSHPGVFTEPQGSLDCLKGFKMSPERQAEDKHNKIFTCKNSPLITAAHELGGSSNRWPRLSNFPVPEVVPLCFPSISSGTQIWQAVSPLESTVSFKVIQNSAAGKANLPATQSQKPRGRDMSSVQNESVTLLGCSCILPKYICRE
jgi:hypothetical protein